MSIVSTTFLPVASIGIGCFLLYVAWKTYTATRNMSDWKIAKGVIIKSDIKPVGEVPTDAVPCIPDVEYQYFVLGVEYKGVSVTLPPDVIYDIEVAKGLLGEYPVGKQVDVFYNPENHRVAVLEKEPSIAPSWVSWLAIITALAFLLYGFAYLFQ